MVYGGLLGPGRSRDFVATRPPLRNLAGSLSPSLKPRSPKRGASHTELTLGAASDQAHCASWRAVKSGGSTAERCSGMLKASR